MFKFSLIINLIIFLNILKISYSADYLATKPDYIKGCKFSDPDNVKCSANDVQSLFRTAATTGISGLDSVPVVDPLQINKIKIRQDGTNAASVDIELKKVTVIGFKNVVVKSNEIDPKNYNWKTELFLPKLRIEGNYELNGRVLLIPLNGKGEMFIDLENMNVLANLKNNLYSKDGFNFFNLTNINVDYTISSLKLNFGNLFNGNKALEDATNLLFNENWSTLADAVKPVIVETIEEIIFGILEKVLNYIPADYFITDLPKI